MFGEEGTAGAVLVEATIIVPILVVMSIYAMDFGLLFYNKMEVQNAAQAGAQWAIANRVYNSSLIQVAAQNATSLSGVTVTPSEFCGCSNDSSGNAVVTQLAAVALVACTPNSPCNGSSIGSGSGVAGLYVQVTATKPYTSLIPTSLIASTPIASTYTNSATATARIQ